MFAYKRLVVAQNERALVFRDGVLQRIENAGVYRLFNWLSRTPVSYTHLTLPTILRV